MRDGIEPRKSGSGLGFLTEERGPAAEAERSRLLAGGGLWKGNPRASGRRLLWLWPDKARADIRAASLRARSGYRLGPRAVARRADLGLRLTSSSRADLAVAGGAGQRPKKTRPWWIEYPIYVEKSLFCPPSILNRIRFSSLNHKTGYLDSSNF